MTPRRLHPLQSAPFHFDSQAQKPTGKYQFLHDRAHLVVTIVSASLHRRQACILFAAVAGDVGHKSAFRLHHFFVARRASL